MSPFSYQDVPPTLLSIGLILANRFTLNSFANFIDVLRLSADEGDSSRPIRCRWRLISSTMKPVMSSCGISLQPDERLGDPTRFDYIAVAGGLMDGIENFDPAYVGFLKQADSAGVPLIGICTGGFFLHKAGLMKGRRCCVSWFHHADFLERFDGLEPVSDQIFVVDRDRLTCSGGASSAHLAAYLVERHIGIAQARKSLNIMIIGDAKSGDKAQPGIPHELLSADDLVTRALHLMLQSVDNPPAINDIAAKLGVSRRKLERRFRSALGRSPAKTNRLMRIDHGKHLLQATDSPVSWVAMESGFFDASHFIKAFKERFGVTPDAYRDAIHPSITGRNSAAVPVVGQSRH